MADQPNILYIFSDQHRGDAMGCVGHPVVKTPNLDRLASESVTYTQCYTNCPLCMPSRASMMSGLYPREHGLWANDQDADCEGPSHVRQVRDAGYHTALIGKSHLYLHGGVPASHSRDRVDVLNAWGFDDPHELHGPIASGKHSSPYTDYLEEQGLLETHRKFINDYRIPWQRGTLKPWEEPPCPLPTEAHLDSYTGRTAANWIRNYKGDKPFYLQVLCPGPHDPFDSPQEYRDMYDPGDMPAGIMDAPEEPVPLNVRRMQRSKNLSGMTVEQKQIMMVNYFAKITLIDHYIGEMLDALEESGLADNTWVIYNSDHGEMLGDHMLYNKIVFYDASVRVPLIVRPPGGSRGWQTGALTDVIDVVASVVDIANAEPLQTDGRSLVSQVQAGADAEGAQRGKDAVISEVLGHTMVFDGRYKLGVESVSERPVELYDVEADPDELNNLVEDAGLESVRQDLIETHLGPLRDRFDHDRYQRWLDLRG